MDIKGRTILLTGGSRGIGRALLGRLVAAGAGRVLIVGRDAVRLSAAAADFTGRVEPLTADLSQPAETDRLLAMIPAVAPDLSILINNAGVQALTDLIRDGGPALVPVLRAEVETNFNATIALTTGLLPLLGRQPAAMIVNVTSGLALAPKQSAPVYCATKAGIRAFTKALRQQARRNEPHLRVVEVLPPLVDTDMTTGRGRAKISAEACAAEILAGMQADRAEILVGKTKLLRLIQGISPSLADYIMRDG